MRWYFAIDETGGLQEAGEHAKLAVRSAAAHGGLEPCLLYHGKPTDFTHWMTSQGVRVIESHLSFLNAIKDAEAAGLYTAHSIGHWLRVGIPLVEQDEEFVLYTDCDVLFLRPQNWADIKPRVFAAGPEFQRENWNYFNSGVMVINVPAMRQTYPAFEAHIRGRLITTSNYDDQWALNEVYRGHWDQLDPLFNWKPYWPQERRATILHFHGPKLNGLQMIANGDWRRDNPTGAMLGKILDAHIDDYIGWANVLGDAWQGIDVQAAVKFSTLASALIRYRKGMEPVTDQSFMNFRMFPD
jgi:hypothetical protein